MYTAGLYVSHGVRIIEVLLYLQLEDHNDPNRYQVPLPLNLEDDGPDDLFNMQLDFEPTFSMKLTRTGEETGLYVCDYVAE